MPKIGILASDDEISRVAAALHTERYRRMIQLFDAHGVKHGDWEALCFALADAHVTGFQFANEKRRPLDWDDFKLAELYLAVEDTGISNASEATRQLSNVEPWKNKFVQITAADRLLERYNQAKASRSVLLLVGLLRKAKAGEAMGTNSPEAME